MLLHGRPLRTRLDLLRPDTARRVDANRSLRRLTLSCSHVSLRSVRRFLHGTTALATTHGYPVPSPRDRSLDSTTKCRLLKNLPWCLHRRKNVGTPKQKSKQLCHPSRLQPETRSFDRKYRQPCACGKSSLHNYTRTHCRASLSTA